MHFRCMQLFVYVFQQLAGICRAGVSSHGIFELRDTHKKNMSQITSAQVALTGCCTTYSLAWAAEISVMLSIL